MSIDWIQKAAALTPSVRNFVDGRWKPPAASETLEKRSPRDGTVLCRFGAGDRNDVADAVAGARRAFEDGRWSKRTNAQRKDVLYRFASLIDQHREELALLECLDVGKPIRDTLTDDVPRAAARIRFCAEASDHLYGKIYAADASSLAYQLHRPIGVIGGIIGWNFPIVLAAEKIAPVLATGNCLILKPSELTSFTAARLAELAVQAGVPEGVLNVIHGGPAVGSALAHHDDVDMLTFTGSSRTGKMLMVAAGQSNMKRLVLECGGKAPNIVFEDAPDLNAVADAIVARAFRNQGQVCTASSRLLVQSSIKEELLQILIKRVSELRPGDPLDPSTRFAALVSQGHKKKVLGYVDSGETEGARLIYRSSARAPFEAGYYVAPVVFDDVSPSQRLAQEEIFGPVLSVIPFKDEAEAIRIANDTVYGLSAIVWTKDLGRAHRLTQAIQAGWIVVNATITPIGGPGIGVMSIGGHKQSGIDVEGGIEGLKAYTSSTAVQCFI